MRRRVRSAMLVLAALALAAAACGGEADTTTTTTQAAPVETTAAPETTATTVAAVEPVRVAFIYDGEVDDGGWNQAYEEARRYVESTMADRVETTFVENIAPGPGTQSALEDFAEQGFDIVICTTYCQDDLFEVTPNYPDTRFLSWAGWSLDEEVGNVGHFDVATRTAAI